MGVENCFDHLIRIGYLSGIDEVKLMCFVNKHTSILVSDVFCMHIIEDRYYPANSGLHEDYHRGRDGSKSV